ncbi:MAG: hypothetical protein WA667_13185 [Candidatus Nitrosopolaris sp.]
MWYSACLSLVAVVQGVKEFDWKPSKVHLSGGDISSNDSSTAAGGETVNAPSLLLLIA